MPRKVYDAKQVARLLQQIERATAKGTAVEYACLDAGISEQTFYRWKARYAGLNGDQVRQLELLREENIRLRRLVAALTRDNTAPASISQRKH